jgi:transcriptional regulator with XRE-family HTH domain
MERREDTKVSLDTFGKRLKHARSRARLTQKGLAEQAGLNARHVAHLEQGLYRMPRFSTVDKLAAALGVDANWLHYGDEARRDD